MEKTIIELRRELDDAQKSLVLAGQMNMAECVPIETRIATDRAYRAAQQRMTEAWLAYNSAL